MATEDISRHAHDPRKRYGGVRLQQGRVTVDDDFNEQARITAEADRRSLLDVVGPAGSPDDGFKLANLTVANGKLDFNLLAGTFYLGGWRLEAFPLDAAAGTVSDTYASQDDWLRMPASEAAVPTAAQTDLVYLEAWEQPVSAVEDDELFEKALGGPDTGTRVRLMRRVRIARQVTGTDCAAAWKALTDSWAASGGKGTINAAGELLPNSKLKVDYESSDGAADLCTPLAQGGYLGAENQTIRVQIADATSFTWGFDNAAPLYRVEILDGTTVKLLTEPKDQTHWPLAGQTIEILFPGATLSNGQKLAEITGHLSRLVGSYDPDLRTIKLDGATPVPGPPAAAFMRVWNRGADTTSPAKLPITAGSYVTLGKTGLKIRLDGNQFVPGAHWIIAARPETPKKVVPWSLEAGRAPHGPRRFAAPLGLLVWTSVQGTITGKIAHDCRPHFQPLTRIQGCCTYTVGDGVHGHGRFTKIQAAIDALPDTGGTVCLLPGIYREAVTIKGRKQVTIEGCGARSRIAPPPAKPGVTVKDSSHVTLRTLGVDVTDAIAIDVAHVHHVALDELDVTARDQSAITVTDARYIELTRSTIRIGALEQEIAKSTQIGRHAAVSITAEDVLVEENTIAAQSSDRFTRTAFGGLHLGGGSERIEVRRNAIRGGSGNAITLGTVAYIPEGVLADGDWWRLVAAWTIPALGWGFTINEAGCIEISFAPDPPSGGGEGGELIPISTGALDDIRIIDNDLSEMGGAGIAVARFFPEEHLQFITVDHLHVEGNRIRRCLRTGVAAIPEAMRDLAAAGVIALADGALVTIKSNVLEESGTTHLEPICGVFALHADGIDVIGNRIADNAPRTSHDDAPRAGFRGGIVIVDARTPPRGLAKAKELGGEVIRENGAPAARILDNVVEVPEGRALLMGAEGAVQISRNHFTTRGPGTASLDYLTMLGSMGDNGFGGLAMKNKGADTDSQISADYLVTKKKQAKLYDSVYGAPMKGGMGGLFDGASLAAGGKSSSVFIDALAFLGGLTVLVFNRGISSEAAGKQHSFRSSLGMYTESTHVMEGAAAAAADARGVPPDGDVQFADNHVVLDLLDPRATLALSSLTFFTFGDLQIAGNTTSAQGERDAVLIQLLAIAMTARVTGNRLREDTTSFLSGWVRGLMMAAATANLSTRCLVVQAPAGMVAAHDNVSLIGGASNECQSLARILDVSTVEYTDTNLMFPGGWS